MNTQTDLQIIIATDWQSEFEQYLVNDYRKVTASHHQPREKTIKTACQHVRVFSMWWEATFEDRFEPIKITNYALRQWQRHSLDKARVAPATWNGRLWALGIFCAWIERVHGPVYAGLMEGLEKKEEEGGEPKHRSLTPKEIHDVLQQAERNVRGSATVAEYAENLRNLTIVTFMINTGLRVGELVDLQLGDIKIGERSGSVRVRNGKGGKARSVDLNKEVRDAMMVWFAHSEHAGNSTTMDIWTGKGTDAICARTVQRTVKDVCASAGVHGVTPHWLRYTFAKCMERKGVSLAEIRRLLGHTNIQTTIIYLASGTAERQSAVEGLY